jgi:hypothetical protein
MPEQKEAQAPPEPAPSPRPRRTGAGDKPADAAESRHSAENGAGLERIRDILLGDILVELERRLARLDSYIANRSSELQHDVRHRTDVLEAHMRKELGAVADRQAHDSGEAQSLIRSLRGENRDAFGQLEQRIARLEERLETSIARVERESREQVLAQAKSFLEELERVRNQLRAALVRELGLEPEPLEEGEHAGTWAASH